MTNKETAFQKIEVLVNRFAEQEEFYKSLTYNETETRRDFIDPFFEALGWDVDNKKGLLPTEREVNHEKRVDVKGHSKSADYSFNCKGKIKFFVEAKKPSVSLKENPEPAIQIRAYAWNTKLNISVLTDFEEFVIYDCTKKISKSDRASKCRIKSINYKNYAKVFDFIYDTFSRESVENGSLEQFANATINDRENETVDNEFLKSIESWRTYLASNIALNNKELDEEEINFCVQQTIDRIVFLKICEDREIETEGNLKKCTKKGNYYQNLYEYFKTADQRYNSGLFDFKKDTLTEKLKIDNKIIETIIRDFDEIGYDFSKIPIEILGYAYEQFLGKVIRLEKSGHAIIETKPEVRKAGGVFYTPEYIVNYIVTNTVGKLIVNKTPEEISKIKILDPACGSGSFLLGAYQYLLDYHQNYYLQNPSGFRKPEGFNKPINQDALLTTAEKKRILINNIFGVDIDLQAVEVTKLSLLIKAMEGETTASIATSLQLFHQRILPSLDSNILCGNSLISPDFEGLGLTPKEERKINVFDWKSAFKNVFTNGGFNIVIGNPPYVKIHNLEQHSVRYYIDNYTLAKGQFDLFTIFIEKVFKLLTHNGLFSFIVPSLFLKGVQYEKLRIFLNNNSELFDSKEYGDGVFEQVKMPTCIFTLKKGQNLQKIDFFKKDLHFFSKIKTQQLGEISKITRGLEIGKDKLMEKGEIKCITGGDIDSYRIKSFHYINKSILKEFSKNDNIFVPKRLLVRETGKMFFSTVDNEGFITTRSIYNVIFNNKIKPEFYLGIINSNLFHYYFKLFIAPETNIFPKIRIIQLKQIPMPIIDLAINSDKLIYDKMVENVEKIIGFNKELPALKLQSQKDHILRKITYTVGEINKLVYQLYNISEEEIEVIEKNA